MNSSGGSGPPRNHASAFGQRRAHFHPRPLASQPAPAACPGRTAARISAGSCGLPIRFQRLKMIASQLRFAFWKSLRRCALRSRRCDFACVSDPLPSAGSRRCPGSWFLPKSMEWWSVHTTPLSCTKVRTRTEHSLPAQVAGCDSRFAGRTCSPSGRELVTTTRNAWKGHSE